jgi:hypothetical protein
MNMHRVFFSATIYNHIRALYSVIEWRSYSYSFPTNTDRSYFNNIAWVANSQMKYAGELQIFSRHRLENRPL